MVARLQPEPHVPGSQIEDETPLAREIARLKAEVETAIADGDGVAGADAHMALIDAEHMQRVVIAVRKYSARTSAEFEALEDDRQ